MQEPGKVDGAVLSPQAFVLRYFDPSGQDRLLVINLGQDQILFHVPEPLLAPPEDHRWKVLWSSEDPKYGGIGITHPDTETEWNWFLQAESATVLVPLAASEEMYKQRLWRADLNPEASEHRPDQMGNPIKTGENKF
jgi:maltooligosyltrehalose trehalohydrolase